MAAKKERNKEKFEDDMDRFILSVTREKPGIITLSNFKDNRIIELRDDIRKIKCD